MRLLYSPAFGPQHLVAALVACALIAPMVWGLVRNRRGDAFRALLLGILIVVLVAWIQVDVEAATAAMGPLPKPLSFPYNPCPACEATMPDWWCSFWHGC